MNSYEYYPIRFQFADKQIYLIYCSGDIDYVAAEEDGLVGFASLDSLVSFSKANGLTPLYTDQCDEYNLIEIGKFLSDSSVLYEMQEELMNFWNLLDDIGERNSDKWSEFSLLSESIRHLHQRLLFESDVLSTGDSKKYEWSDDEISTLQKLFDSGLNLFDKSIIEFNESA